MTVSFGSIQSAYYLAIRRIGCRNSKRTIPAENQCSTTSVRSLGERRVASNISIRFTPTGQDARGKQPGQDNPRNEQDVDDRYLTEEDDIEGWNELKWPDERRRHHLYVVRNGGLVGSVDQQCRDPQDQERCHRRCRVQYECPECFGAIQVDLRATAIT